LEIQETILKLAESKLKGKV